MRHAVAQGEGTDVLLRTGCLRIREVDIQVAQDLIGPVAAIGLLLLGDEAAVHQLLGFEVLAFEEQLANGGQALGSLGIAVVGFRAAPQGNFIQDNMFTVYSPIGHHAQAAIAQGKGFLPDGGRSGVPQTMVAGVGRSSGSH